MKVEALVRSWLAVGWLLLAAIVFFSLTPAPPELGVDQGDKLGHFAAYGLVTLWFAQLYTQRRQRVRLFFAMTALGVLMEYAQLATGYRSFEVADMAADALGAALGWLAAPPRLPSFFIWAKHRLAR